MKKIINLFLIICGMLVLVSCDDFLKPEEHEHKMSVEWTNDEESHWHTCEGCDDLLEKAAHVFGEWEVKVEATEETVGSRERSCSVCEYVETEEIAKLEHTHTPGAEATCTTDQTCTSCGEVLVAKKGHTEEVVEGYAATCTEAGLTDGKKCSVCGEVLLAQQEIPALGHKNAETVEENRVESTCTKAGSYDSVIKCSVCKEELSRETKALELAAHTEKVVEGYAATCTETGLTDGKKCSVCGEVLVAQQEIAALGHKNAEAIVENRVESTCTKAGSYDSVIKCSVCEKELSRETKALELAAHTEEVVAGKAATCTEAGLTDGKKCSVCSEVLVAQQEIAATGKHNYVDLKFDEVNHWYECGCGAKGEAEEHFGGTATFDAFAECEVCHQPYGEKLALVSVSNVSFEDNILAFDNVLNAEGYLLEFYKEDVKVFEERISSNALDVTTYNLAGTYTVKIQPYNGTYTAEFVDHTFTILSVVTDVKLEAERNMLNFAKQYKDNALASGGAYAGSIDNCGQGFYINYFNYVAGDYTLEAYYMTASVGSFHGVYINGVKQGRLDYTENTGWGTAERIAPACATLTITLTKGWNTICILKDGTQSENWGGWAEMDYFIIKGTNATYNIDDYSEYNLDAPDTYRLEAELGGHIKRYYEGDNAKWYADTIVPGAVAGTSHGYRVAGIDNYGQGLEWYLECRRAGKYRVTVSFAHAYEANCSKIYFYHSTTHLREQMMTIEYLQTNYLKGILDLDAGSGWDNYQVNSITLELELSEGDNFIYVTKDSEYYFQLDYIDLTYIG